MGLTTIASHGRTTRLLGVVVVIVLIVIAVLKLKDFVGSNELSLEDKERGGVNSTSGAAAVRGKKKNVKIPLKFDLCYMTRDHQQRIINGSSLKHSAPDKLKVLERQRWEEIKPHLPRIRGFYHTSLWRKFWADVIIEQIGLMDSELLEVADLFFNVVGRSKADLDKAQKELRNSAVGKSLKHANRIIFNFNETVERFVYKRSKGKEFQRMTQNIEISEGEYSTLSAMHSHCVSEVAAGRESYVFYLHNKGGCCSRTKSNNRIDPTNDNVCAWREVMNAFNIQYPSICARALRQGNYATCGFEFLVDYHTAHYSGNFFWANCKHVASLSLLAENRFDSFAAELFLFNRTSSAGNKELNRRFGQRCGYSTFNCCMDFYKSECKRAMWDWKVLKMLSFPGLAGMGVSNTDLLAPGEFAENGKFPAPGECFG